MIYSILLIEDTLDIGESIKLYLESSNFSVDRATTIQQAKELLHKHTYSCVVIDWMLPDGNGTEICQIIKNKYPQVPCILETAKFQIEDKIEGFDSGADDYLVKPFDLRELEIRINNLIERFTNAIELNYDKITIGELVINVDSMEITKNNQTIHCSAHERVIVKMLCEDPNKVVSRIELCEYIRGDEAQRMSENKLDVLISGLRKKLGKNIIETVKGVGYKLYSQDITS